MVRLKSINMTSQAEDDQSASALVGNDLVDDHLGEKRVGEADQLNSQQGEQDVPPDFLMLEQFGDKPEKPRKSFSPPRSRG